MARKTTDELVTIIRVEAGKYISELKKAERSTDKFAGSGEKSFAGIRTSYLKMAAAITVGAFAAKKVFDFARAGAQVTNLRKSFELMGGTAASLDRLSGSLNRTLDDATLIRMANMARTLGINNEQFSKLAEVGKAASIVLGQDVQFAINSIITGTARQSRMLLDNIGIIVDVDKANEAYAISINKAVGALTEAERKQAFINATIEKGQKLIAGAGKDSATDGFDQFTTSVKNFGDTLASSVNTPFADFLSLLARNIDLLNTPIPEGTFADLLGVTSEMPEIKALDFRALERVTFEPRPPVAPGPGPGDGAAALALSSEDRIEQIVQQMAIEEELWIEITEGRLLIQAEGLIKEKATQDALIEQQAGHIQHLSDLDAERTETERFMSEMRVQFAEDEEAKKAMFREQSIAGIKTTLGNLAAAFPKQKEFAIVNSLISTYQGASQALKDVPFPANIAAAASVLAVGLKQVQAIKSASPSGGGPQGFNVSTGANLPVLSQPTSPNVTVIIKGGGLESLIEDINIQVEDNNVRLVASESFTSIEADSLR